MAEQYGTYIIDTFKMGRDLWRARVRRLDSAPFVADGIELDCLHAGYSWSSSDEALQDAKVFVDRFLVRESKQ